MRLAGALKRNAVSQILNPLRIFVHDCVLVGLKPTWRKAVNRDAFLPPIICETHCQLFHSPTACAIRTQSGITRNTCNRADGDYPPVTFWNHMFRYLL